MTKTWPLAGHGAKFVELTRDVGSGRLGHAYLFAGPASVGKFAAAKFFGNQILCQQKIGDLPCGVCDTCQRVAKNASESLVTLDRVWVEGTDEDLEELAKSTNINQSHRLRTPKAKTEALGVDDIRELESVVNQTKDGHRVVAISRVERMTTGAVNAFLKTLEEPPADTTFILTTDHLPLLLPTLVSRCRVVNFSAVNPEVICQEVKKKFPQLKEEEIHKIAKFSLGKPGEAMRLAADPERLTTREEDFRRIERVIGSSDTLARMSLAEEASGSRDAAFAFLESLLFLLRTRLLASGEKETAQKNLTAIQSTTTAYEQITGNANTRLVLENLLLSI